MFLYSAYPVLWTAQSVNTFPPLADLFIPTPTRLQSLGSILVMQQLRNDYSLTCPQLSIARYPLIQLSRLSEASWRERKCPNFETVAKGDSNPGSHDCESGILPLSYRAPHDFRKIAPLLPVCSLVADGVSYDSMRQKFSYLSWSFLSPVPLIDHFSFCHPVSSV